jgi:microcystin-dependent protein
MDQYLAMILQFGGNFAPTQFALCQGQLLAISSNTALFSLLGTSYGGNGTTTFGLPDLRGRTPIGAGQGPGLSDYVIGDITGNENETILSSNLPSHSHTVQAVASTPTQSSPSGNYLAESPKEGSGPTAKILHFYVNTAPNTSLNPSTVSLTGGNTPVSILQPYNTITYIIAVQGIFPARN